MRSRLDPNQYIEGILAGDRAIVSRAITLVESNLATDRELAAKVLDGILAGTGNAMRIGLTGVPGVGKSTFIDSFGSYLTSKGSKVAVLAVDPSSTLSGGSILGDKTRMVRLSRDPRAFIRPSPSAGSLGGVTRTTRESMLICEAAGFDVILVETVGVGQSETAVKNMVDFFLLLILPGAGDDLQGIKKGIMEMADALVINKADGENLRRAEEAKAYLMTAIRLFSGFENDWVPKVTCASATTGKGLDEIWAMIGTYFDRGIGEGWLAQKRTRQKLTWMHETVSHLLEESFHHHPEVIKAIEVYEKKVLSGEIVPTVAGSQLVKMYLDIT